MLVLVSVVGVAAMLVRRGVGLRRQRALDVGHLIVQELDTSDYGVNFQEPPHEASGPGSADPKARRVARDSA
ncbi:hypothetical protein AB0K00_19250 [Dactylosporangium sp. NPDC049525]|uniref:hypothetical protein n=1 Tax=Dactylosporangium sp. NPDC049525 TaxID=3154730 RepID=UPI00342CAA4A